MKKIGFVIPWYADSIPGGAEMELREVTSHLHAAGMNIEILTTCVKEFGADWSVNYYPEGEDKASGTGPGLNPDGLDQLDQDLKKRGLVGVLPLPEQPENKSGVVLIRVTVDASGRVTSAAYEPKGSTTSDVELVAEARKAALRTRFTESRTVIEGGVITYIFKLTAE